jgi:hypothetical protein
MDLSSVLNRIKFKIGSMDDINSKAVNPLVTTSNILYELNAQSIKYAITTKGIQDFYSVSVDSNTQFLDAPQYALRSLAYKFATVIVRGWANPIDIRGQRDVVQNFRTSPIKGISSWLMVLNEINKQRLFLYPMPGTNYAITTLTSGISAVDTTIPVTSTASFVTTGGRITIGSEKILYEYRDATHFYGCVRGLELTTAATHSTNDSVNENNLIINYSRLPVPLTITDSPTAPQLSAELEIVDDHIEGLCDVVAYNLLIKIDPSRAVAYKIDGDALFEQYKLDIGKGYNKMRSGVNVREPYQSESGIPFSGNRY